MTFLAVIRALLKDIFVAFHPQHTLRQPEEEHLHQYRDDAGGDSHHRQNFNKLIDHVFDLVRNIGHTVFNAGNDA